MGECSISPVSRCSWNSIQGNWEEDGIAIRPLWFLLSTELLVEMEPSNEQVRRNWALPEQRPWVCKCLYKDVMQGSGLLKSSDSCICRWQLWGVRKTSGVRRLEKNGTKPGSTALVKYFRECLEMGILWVKAGTREKLWNHEMQRTTAGLLPQGPYEQVSPGEWCSDADQKTDEHRGWSDP